MNEIEFCNQLKSNLKEIGIRIDEKECTMFYQYMRLLQEWNNKINLTAIIEDKDILVKHFVDSLTIYQYIKVGDKLIDVGTGAGFPSIPIGICNQNVDCTLLDSLNKRIIFLNEVKLKLGMKNINTIHGRAEDFAHLVDYRECFDIATARAVAPIDILAEYLLPYLKIGGLCICMKSNDIDDELDMSKKAIEVIGGKIEKVEQIILPNTDIVRKNILIRKCNPTPVQYPRKPGIPKKDPIR